MSDMTTVGVAIAIPQPHASALTAWRDPRRAYVAARFPDASWATVLGDGESVGRPTSGVPPTEAIRLS